MGSWRGSGSGGRGGGCRGVTLAVLGAGTGGCREVDGCWVSDCRRLCTLGGGVTDTLGEDTGDVYMAVEVVSAGERLVVLGVLLRVLVPVDVVHAGVCVDDTGREEGEEDEGDTVETVDVAVSVWV
ncbi:hypothetical protein NDU88_006740 [Pleurodeles waltl]|uniref:Uncharacterized protein n=1 Tax=Pleurodeles waltl TaxID=8319 RepID=A0AAV7RQB6_PLEWA|nr:hypothetical protein NDU88_006740 [Pleurodeles waltl]